MKQKSLQLSTRPSHVVFYISGITEEVFLSCRRGFTFINTCGGSDGAEVAVADDLKSEKLELLKLARHI